MRNYGSLVTAIDNIRDYWPSSMVNRHYYVINDDITKTQIDDKYDLITCISVLEHIETFDAAVANLFKLLSPSGHLILTFPYTEKEYIKNVYDLSGSSYGQDASYICSSYSRNELNCWLKKHNGEIIEQEYWQY